MTFLTHTAMSAIKFDSNVSTYDKFMRVDEMLNRKSGKYDVYEKAIIY